MRIVDLIVNVWVVRRLELPIINVLAGVALDERAVTLRVETSAAREGQADDWVTRPVARGS